LGLEKQFLKLGDRPLLIWTLQAFEKAATVSRVIVAVNLERKDELSNLVRLYNLQKVVKVVEGGITRQISVSNGLKALPQTCQIVVVHDGARPFVTPELIDKAVKAQKGEGGVVVAVPVVDTVKEVKDDRVVKTLDRQRLWQVQTPQVFPFKVIRKAYEKAEDLGWQGTDDAALVERLGYPVKIVEGTYENIKITNPVDLILAEALIKNRK
jgi:2-C-methyl-D-erythritol 4-phosphate cytidylyltransferase